ncbi:MAG: translation elongation factor Ts [Planctomycetota bacterium]
MAAITAQMVKDLRHKTDLPMMECKKALTENNGDLDAAMEWLRQKHKGKLAERSDKATGEGRIAIFIDEAGKNGGIVELQCETAPVAKHEMFIELAEAFARKVAEGSDDAPDVEALKGDPTLEKQFTEVFGKMRENMNLTRARKITGAYLASYVHHDGKSGILLALDGTPNSDKAIGADLCMHTMFSMPLAVDRSGVPAEEVEKVRELARNVAKEEGKPDQIVEKIVEGKVNAFYGERVLLEQIHVKTDDYGKAKIGDVLQQAGVNTVTAMEIMKVGE